MSGKGQTISFFASILEYVTTNPELELEVKFLKQFQNYVTSRNFVSQVNASIFEEVLKWCMNNTYLNELPVSKYTNKLVEKRKNKEDKQLKSMRFTSFENGSSKIIQKSREKIPKLTKQLFDQGFKIHLSKECIPNSKQRDEFFHQLSTLPPSQIIIRENERHSFEQYLIDNHNNQIPIFRFDLFTSSMATISHSRSK